MGSWSLPCRTRVAIVCPWHTEALADCFDASPSLWLTYHRAGSAPVFSQTCSGVCTDYIAEPSNFDNAFFEIKSIRAYSGAS